MILLRGSVDDVVPVVQAEDFTAAARARGDDARARTVEGAGHFDVVAPFAPAWPLVAEAIASLVSRR